MRLWSSLRWFILTILIILSIPVGKLLIPGERRASQNRPISPPSGLQEANAAPLLPVPLPPSRLNAVAGDGRVVLSWFESENVTGYNVKRSTKAGGPYTIIVSRLQDNTYTDSTAPNGNTYYYVVSASNSVGTSGVSNEASAVPTAPLLTSAHVIQIAQNFCRAVHAPVESFSAKTIFPAPNQSSQVADSNNQSRWFVQFGSPAAAEVEIVDATGVVSWYYNYALTNRIATNHQLEGTPLSQASAVRIANSVLHASGQTDQLDKAQASYSQDTEPATEAGQTWDIYYPRLYQSIPYHYQTAHVMLLGDTGEVEAMSLVYTSPVPASTTMTVTRTQAAKISSIQLKKVGGNHATLDHISQEIVQPNAFWSGNFDSTSIAGPSKSVWACYYIIRGTASTTALIVYVNGLDGAVIGGEAGGSSRVTEKRQGKAPLHQTKQSKHAR